MKDIIANYSHLLPQKWPDLLSGILVSAIVILLFFLLRLVLLRIALRGVREDANRLVWRRISGYLAFFIGVGFLIPIWFPAIREMAAFLGIFGAGILLAFKEVLLNLAGWVYIVARRPFDPGNRVLISGVIGDVIDIRLMEFSVLEVRSRETGGQSTGRVVHIPNSLVFTQTLANATKAFSFYWNEIQIPLKTGSDWRRAVEIVQAVAARAVESVHESDVRLRHSRQEYAIRYRALTPSVYVEYRDSAIVLSLRYLCEPRQLRQVTDRIWREILSDFENEPGIQLKADD